MSESPTHSPPGSGRPPRRSSPGRAGCSAYADAKVQQSRTQALGPATGGWKKPFRFEGFRCVPTFPDGLNGYQANFTCKLQGADVPTTVTLKFGVQYTIPISQQAN